MESKCDHLIDFNLVKKIYNEHVSGKRNWSFRIWSVLMFLSWFEKELKLLNLFISNVLSFEDPTLFV